jgi:hypothetical protein
MNEGISDSEGDNRTLRPSIHWWLSPPISAILRELDNVTKRAKARRLVHRKGNRPLPQKPGETKVLYKTSPSSSLPRNWYRENWYGNLDMYQKHDLKASDPEELPTIVSCHLIGVGLYFDSQ